MADICVNSISNKLPLNCRMTSLLRKFRINYSAVIEITGIGKKPSQERYYNNYCLTILIIVVYMAAVNHTEHLVVMLISEGIGGGGDTS